MFRIEYLNLKGHPQLGDINLRLSDVQEYKPSNCPYTSVIIGPNGTGKSFILRTVADIFRVFENHNQTKKRSWSVPYDFHLRYRIHHNVYDIIAKEKGGKKRKRSYEYLYFKNRPDDVPPQKNRAGKTHNYETNEGEIELPSRILVSSVMSNDRFVHKNSSPNDFYQYLGVRTTSSTMSTRSSVKKATNHIFNARVNNKQFTENLRKLLEFIDFGDSFKVIYKTKINKLFFSQNLDEAGFRKYFEHWWDKDFEFTKRKKNNPLWSIPYYKKHVRDDPTLMHSIIRYLNYLPTSSDRFFNKKRSSSNLIKIDLFDSTVTDDEIALIRHLENLDIINLEGFQVNKSNSQLGTGEISSGEYHLLVTLIGIFANVDEDALILIDEPEISLHPNWQMQYVSFLKKAFTNFSSCHFVLTTHSHFLVSDLEGDSSYIAGLKREGGEIQTVDLDRDTFGWSAEQVLLEVFNVPTTRNYFVAEKIGDILELIAQKDRDNNLIRESVQNLIKMNLLSLSKTDPLKGVWDQIVEKYGK